MKVIKDGSVTSPKGFKAAGISCGIKAKERAKDLALIYSEMPASAEAVQTKNRVKSAAVLVTRENLSDGKAQAIVANSGNANACTGDRGLKDALQTAQTVADDLGIFREDVLVASTGVIGKPLPMEKIEAGIHKIVPQLRRGGGDDAAVAIMTTDTVPKKIAVEVELSDGIITIGGIAKGSGMIAPDMATMLAFLTTDARVEPDILREFLRSSVDQSFNMITVDGDMSTNDTVIVLANGASGTGSLSKGSDDAEGFKEALDYVTRELALMIVKDGEGATKFVTIQVEGAKTFNEAKRVGMSVANSNLVKTAIFGEDPNWGRFLAAVGYSGVDVEERKIKVSLGDLVLFEKGLPRDFNQEEARSVLSTSDILIQIDLGQGRESAKVYTCDLSYDYVKLNAEYTT